MYGLYSDAAGGSPGCSQCVLLRQALTLPAAADCVNSPLLSKDSLSLQVSDCTRTCLFPLAVSQHFSCDNCSCREASQHCPSWLFCCMNLHPPSVSVWSTPLLSLSAAVHHRRDACSAVMPVDMAPVPKRPQSHLATAWPAFVFVLCLVQVCQGQQSAAVYSVCFSAIA